jgi:hypothetical protein
MTCVIIPQRGREAHLPRVLASLKFQIPERFIFVVTQIEGEVFAKALLMNMAFKLLQGEFTHFIFHDADMVVEKADLRPCSQAVHLADQISLYVDNQDNWKIPYDRYFGGSVMVPREEFIKINGFSTFYRGWGAEDDDLMIRLERYGSGWSRRPGRLFHIPHVRMSFEFSQYNHPYLARFSNGEVDNSLGLSTSQAELVGLSFIDRCPMLKFKVPPWIKPLAGQVPAGTIPSHAQQWIS